ncbi:hypothetical protein VNO78_35119 [Psophocarpus tetragonolobus]|uniref:Uncharacterized protein n=1 Tax=Psophocarpus tetragonolobus TaxID=3891 RepID=A0AAN9NRZ1_PSOTE
MISTFNCAPETRSKHARPVCFFHDMLWSRVSSSGLLALEEVVSVPDICNIESYRNRISLSCHMRTLFTFSLFSSRFNICSRKSSFPCRSKLSKLLTNLSFNDRGKNTFRPGLTITNLTDPTPSFTPMYRTLSTRSSKENTAKSFRSERRREGALQLT